MIHDDLLYDGPRLQWRGKGIFRATSGMAGRQSSAQQCDRAAGPIPEGRYFFWLREDKTVPTPTEDCGIPATWNLQTIPGGAEAGSCEPYWALWGRNRIRLTRIDPLPCPAPRDGFYIHDSAKGFTHGCIEVEPLFFTVLRQAIVMARTPHVAAKDRLHLMVKYLPGQTTNGGTYRFG